jgi:hypothetical protein
MGTWGAGIFDDDITCDVRGEYREAIRAGVPGPQATDRIVRELADEPDPFWVHARVWLALAATQSQLGRLEERVRARALEVIDSGEDLATWHAADPGTRRRRRAALRRLRRRLVGPQRPPVRLRPAWRQETELEPGQHLLFRLPDGMRVLLRVLDVQEFRLETTEGTLPVVMLLDWRDGRPVPAGPALDRVPNARRRGALWFRVIRKGPRDPVRRRTQVLPGRWSEAPAWRGVDGGLGGVCHWDELRSHVPW